MNIAHCTQLNATFVDVIFLRYQGTKYGERLRTYVHSVLNSISSERFSVNSRSQILSLNYVADLFASNVCSGILFSTPLFISVFIASLFLCLHFSLIIVFCICVLLRPMMRG